MKPSFTSIIILILAAIVIMQRLGCSGEGHGYPPTSDTTIIRDTLWEKHDTTIYKKMTVHDVIHDTLPVQYLPSPMYDELLVQYNEMVEEFLAKNIYLDTITVSGTAGNILVKDTVQYNKLGGRSYVSSISIPKITETVTINNYAPPRRSLFIGGGLSANKTAFQLLDAGLLYKTKKDKIYGVSVGIGQDLKPVYGGRLYWKLF